MEKRSLPREEVERTFNTYQACLNEGYLVGREPSASLETAKRLNMRPDSVRHRIRLAESQYGLTPKEPDAASVEAAQGDTAADRLKEENRVLKLENERLKRDELTREEIRRFVFELKDATPEPPKWLLKPSKRAGLMGVPTLFCSDWHWGEIVKPDAIGGANAFDVSIAHARVERMLTTVRELLFEEFDKPAYDGIVLALGGDMISGNIHEELTETNEIPIMPTVLDIFGVLVECIEKLLDWFPNVFVPGVTGNHGRMTRKPRAKYRNESNFDWLIYHMLARHFENEKRVTFHIPDGPDAYYRVYGHRYCLTHGDQFRGGDGITGALMPIMRGRHKKSSRDVNITGPWDTIIMGHWHQLMQLLHLIVNGSLKGYDEYAFGRNFEFEPPAQALWINHPVHGITHQMPVYLGERKPSDDAAWVSVPR